MEKSRQVPQPRYIVPRKCYSCIQNHVTFLALFYLTSVSLHFRIIRYEM